MISINFILILLCNIFNKYNYILNIIKKLFKIIIIILNKNI